MCSLILFHDGQPLTFEAETDAELMTNLRRWLALNRESLNGGVTLPCEHEVVTLRQRRGIWYLCWGHQVVQSQWRTAKKIFAEVCAYEIKFDRVMDQFARQR